MRIVLDTGIFVSALITKGTPPDLLYQAWRKGKFDLVTSQIQLQELERVLLYKKLQTLIQPFESQFLLRSLRNYAELLDQLPVVNYSSDPDDNWIIATALAGKANLIVSGDKRHMLSLQRVEAVLIVTARAAVESIYPA